MNMPLLSIATLKVIHQLLCSSSSSSVWTQSHELAAAFNHFPLPPSTALLWFRDESCRVFFKHRGNRKAVSFFSEALLSLPWRGFVARESREQLGHRVEISFLPWPLSPAQGSGNSCPTWVPAHGLHNLALGAAPTLENFSDLPCA